ncbi:hypothetical protein THRCLA_20774 [Thraustotheca clavata]|uniref:Protein kinase domain-containing protein n=1 Tax=Thraustotheca clavata TaxID=74557 RepID=A0A1W0A3L4_9STRA|nr:hypothetical protein THRCLA_20774 [Thraustotheca clavata]
MNEPIHRPFNRDKIAMEIAGAMDKFVDFDGNGLLHRNLSSLTIFISSEGRIVIGGLFAARIYDDVVTQNVVQSLWAAPEILRGDDNYDFSVDVYSYGVILTELDTLLHPFHQNTMKELQRNLSQWICNEGRTPTMSDTCPQWYRNLVAMCLVEDFNQRPSFQQIVDYIQTHSAL